MKNIKNYYKYLVYQPKVDLNTLEIIGLEALVRFLDVNSKKVLNTENVINSIDSIDEMIELTNEVIDMAILDLVQLERLKSKVSISINMSSKELCNINLYSWVEERFKDYKHYINRIEIEITERHEVDNIDIMKNRISLLKELGFTVSIDDLGTGFNQKDIIKYYSVDIAKIDKSFVIDFDNKKEELKYIVDISKENNVKLLVEGIELKKRFKKILRFGN